MILYILFIKIANTPAKATATLLVARQLAYCLRDMMICFISNTLLFYLE